MPEIDRSFCPTGETAIDLVLAAVAAAGKGYHHTENWTNDECRPSYVDQIQEAANRAATALRTARTEALTEAAGIVLSWCDDMPVVPHRTLFKLQCVDIANAIRAAAAKGESK